MRLATIRPSQVLATLLFSAAVLPSSVLGANAILWEAPQNITMGDWIWGIGGKARAPKPPFEFVEEDLKGTNPKIRVRDAKGDRWTVKFGGENHSDIFTSRLLHALGYVTEPNYFVAAGVISGVHDLKRAKPFIARNGAFNNARFKLRDHKMLAHVEGETWSWDDNPFLATRELNGLKILLMLTSNWDGKDARDGAGSNTSVYAKPNSVGRLYYAVDDWGASMGKWGGFFERDKWNPTGYRDQTRKFVRLTAGQSIEWGYRGKHVKDITAGIGLDDIRWLLIYLSAITDAQLRAGLRASGAVEPDIQTLSQSIRDRIRQLQGLASASNVSASKPLPPASAVR